MKLRRGIRWSDGEPFTTEDVRFFWEDVRLNEELTPKLGGRYNPGGESGLSHAKKSRAVIARLVAALSILRRAPRSLPAACFACHHIRKRAISAGLAVGQVPEKSGKNRWLRARGG